MQKYSTKKTTKPSTKSDALAPFQKEAATLINILFDDDHGLPDFVVDEVNELLTELEGEVQVMWNYRSIMYEALPLMLKAADEQGIDWRSRNSTFVNLHLGSMYATRRKIASENRAEEIPEEVRAARREARELELDAEALARILNSPRVPEEYKNSLADRLLEHTDEFALHPDLIRARFLLATERDAQSAEGSDE